jgi:tetratricopeptide (TPR) repeat protein
VPHSARGFFYRCCLTCTLLIALLLGKSDLDGSPQSADPPPRDAAAHLLDDPPTPFEPLRPRSESEGDRLRSAALFAAGRIHQKGKRYDQALRFYQRCARYDPQNVDVLRRVIQLARHLDRHTETARYSVLLVDREVSDSLDLLRAFVYLREAGQRRRALNMYEKEIQRRKPDLREPAWIELHKLAGDAYLLEEQYERAAEALSFVDGALRKPEEYGLDDETVELLEGGDPTALYELIGEAYLKAKRIDRAKAAFDRADRQEGEEDGTEDDNDVQGRKWYHAARVHAAAGRAKKAEAVLQRYFDAGLSSEGDGPYRLLAEILQPAKRQIKRLETLHEQDTDNHELAYFLGEKYINAERFQDARRLIERYVDDHPQGRALRCLVQAYHQIGDHEAFLDLAGGLAERFQTLAGLGEPLEKVAADKAFTDAVIAAARKRAAGAQDGLDFGQMLAAAMLASQAQQYDAASEFFAMAASQRDDEKGAVFETWGLDLLAAERYADAEGVFRRALLEKLLESDRPIFRYYLSAALAMQEKYDAALAAAREAVKDNPDSAEFIYRVAWILYMADRRDEAIRAYTQLIERFDADQSSVAVRDLLREVRLTLSHLHTLQKEMSLAEELLEQVLDEFPEDRGAGNDLGYLWADRGVHLERALKMIQAACDEEPDNAAYRDSLGWVLYRLGRHEEAIEHLKRAAETEDPDGVILEHLGDVHKAMDEAPAAQKAWQRALKAFESEEDVEGSQRVRDKLQRLTDGVKP